jgi:hypothetical protein
VKVHPIANLLPMMADDELADLAADIKANGLAHPIVTGEWTDPDGEVHQGIIDGRNRLAACKIAGVEPTYTQLNGQDPVAFIFSVNAARRQMMRGAFAMIAAKACPELAKGGRGQKGVAATTFPMVSPDKLAHARKVLVFAPELADAVIASTTSLDTAYKEARLREGNASGEAYRLVKLRKERPDLADAVVEQRMTLHEADTKARAEAEERKQQRYAVTMNLVDGVKALDRIPEQAAELAAEFDPAVAASRGESITPDRLRNVAAYVTALAKAMEKRQPS